MFHDMTPVAGGAAYADQQRLIFLLQVQMHLAHTVASAQDYTGMLQQVGAGGMHQCISVVRRKGCMIRFHNSTVQLHQMVLFLLPCDGLFGNSQWPMKMEGDSRSWCLDVHPQAMIFHAFLGSPIATNAYHLV